MQRTLCLLLTALCLMTPLMAHAADAPRSIQELWADFDPRRDPLKSELVHEWREEGAILRYVRFYIGTFKGRPAYMAAFYGFPEGVKERLPAVMHIHGGGQRASLDEVRAMVARGYAALSVNWGGREMERAQPGDPNTDWGAVDPTQQNVAGYFSLKPGPKQLYEDRENPKNCNWYLLTLGCRRGLTFLERQPEVDPRRLGIHGLSMGGNLTMYVAGTDRRVRAAVPAVGGQGWRWEDHPFTGGTARQESIQGDLELFRRTLSFEAYAPHIHCPVMHRSASNDFHGWMDDVYRTDALIRSQPVRHSWSPHLNHRLTPEVAVTMPLWFDHFLKGASDLPETPASQIMPGKEGAAPLLRVRAHSRWPVAKCEIYYSVDPDPRSRFWRSAEVSRTGDEFTATLPVDQPGLPLFAFANVYYTLPKPVTMPQLPEMGNAPIREVCLSTSLHRVDASALHLTGAPTTDRCIDDFRHGWRDWFRLNIGNRDYWQNWTRKITDPRWRGPANAKLALSLKVTENNRITIVLIENEWRSYIGPRKTYLCVRDLRGLAETQKVTVDLSDFKALEDGSPLKSWDHLDLLGLCVVYNDNGNAAPPPVWHGSEPEFVRLEWASTPP